MKPKTLVIRRVNCATESVGLGRRSFRQNRLSTYRASRACPLVDPHNPSPPKTDQGRSVSDVGIYPNSYTRQSETVAYVSGGHARSVNRVCGCSTRCLSWATIWDERLRTQKYLDIALAVDRNCSRYQTRLIGKLYHSTFEHPIAVSYIRSSQRQPRLETELICDLV